MSISRNFGIVALLTVAVLHGTDSASLSAESQSEILSITLYRLDKTAWSSKESEFITTVVNQANTYCSNSPSSCGLSHWINTAVFTNTSVSVSAVADGKDLEVSFWIALPSGANVSSASQTQFVLNRVAVKELITNIRVDIQHIVGAYVTYIEDDYYGIPPDNIANQVIIPIAFAVLITVIIVAFALHFWNKRKSRRHRKNEINSSKVTPSHTNQGAMGKNIDTHHNLKGSNVNNTTKEAHQVQKLPSPPPSLTHTVRSNNEFMEVDETYPRHPPPSHLPTLPSEDAEGDHKKDRKHKKKKKKKHRRQHSEDTGNGQSDTENTRKRSIKSQEHENKAFNEDNYYDSDNW